MTAENKQTYKNVAIHSTDDFVDSNELPLDEAYIEKLNRANVMTAFERLLESGMLTDTQGRRFILYIVNGSGIRDIAELENVYPNAVEQSIQSAIRALKKYLEKI